MKYVTRLGERDYTIEIINETHISVDGTPYEIDFHSINEQPVYSLLVNHASHEAYIYPAEDEWQVLLKGRLFNTRVIDEREMRLKPKDGENAVQGVEYHLNSPMPGLVVSVPVEEGQQVKKGDILLVLESMKMQNELRSPQAGKVTRLRVKPGDRVDLRQALLSVGK